MPSRRGHSNSHHGCIQCKTGRVKCDEGQPSCGRCRKKGRTCTYRHLLAPYDASERRLAGDAHLILRAGSLSSAEGEQQNTSETEIVGIHRSPPRFGTTGLPSSDPTEQLLLHHYFGHLASLSFGSVDKWDIVPAFRQAVTRHVLTEAYVNQVVLAFAATHLASVYSPVFRNGSAPQLVTALKYKASTLELFRPALASSLTPSSCESGMAAAGLLVACEFALPMMDNGFLGVEDQVEALSRIASLFQGAVALFRMGCRGPRVGEGSPALQIRKTVFISLINELPWVEAEESVENVLEIVRSRGDGEHARRDVLLEAGEKLQVALRRVAAARGSYNVACMWLGMVPSTYIELVTAKDPLALVLMAHWAVCLKGIDLERAWWLRGWPEMIIRTVINSIGEAYHGLLVWPLQEIETTQVSWGPRCDDAAVEEDLVDVEMEEWSRQALTVDS
ncbi:fungal Zn binuclear cluster domain-containing protein [Colletotrichum kahawae]|uniref:Fungal Zn binuclear cluster domain-containing protein n=1 Tax=Colletotrichum kahawae TaxID=34407 RepID=A0AAD9YCL2_COLKA|nr:fungal Zn binuclear cluster domain-containing protein [Colletotrichum kahawae]